MSGKQKHSRYITFCPREGNTDQHIPRYECPYGVFHWLKGKEILCCNHKEKKGLPDYPCDGETYKRMPRIA